MAGVDSSALIPLARSGRIDMLEKNFETVYTLEEVRSETIEAGKKGSSVIDQAFQDLIEIRDVEESFQDISSLEGISNTDAKILSLAEENDGKLISNDNSLNRIAESRGVKVYWPTSVVLMSVKEDLIDDSEARNCIRDMVSEGLNLSPEVYDRLIRSIQNL